MLISLKNVIVYVVYCVCVLFNINIAQGLLRINNVIDWNIYGFLLEFTSCVTPNNINGECINIIHCQFILDFLRTNANSYGITYLQKSTCGYEGIYPLVCCPQSSSPGQPSITEAQPITPGNEVPATNPPAPVSRYTLPVSPNCGLNSLTMNNKVVNGDPAKLGKIYIGY